MSVMVPFGELTQVDKTQSQRLGERTEDVDGNIYRYCKVVYTTAALDIVVGMDIQPCTDGNWIGSHERAHPTVVSTTSRPLGIAMAAMDVSAGEIYGWFLVDGYGTLHTGADDAVAKGHYLVAAAAVNGACDNMEDGEEEQVYAQAMADDDNDADTVAARVFGL